MRAPDVRETFDQLEFMLDGPALRFGIFLGSEQGQLVGPRVATPSLLCYTYQSAREKLPALR